MPPHANRGGNPSVRARGGGLYPPLSLLSYSCYAAANVLILTCHGAYSPLSTSRAQGGQPVVLNRAHRG